MAEQLQDFSTDGCSHFPDGTLSNPKLWCACCITHDKAYWQGGTFQQKRKADKQLRQCILQKTNNKLLADTMFAGVTVGGLPIFPMWYRWGYGWQYGRGFKKLNQYEQHQVGNKLGKYYLSIIGVTNGFCEFEHPAKKIIRRFFERYKGNLSGEKWD
jgi:hypothetical protein